MLLSLPNPPKDGLERKARSAIVACVRFLGCVGFGFCDAFRVTTRGLGASLN